MVENELNKKARTICSTSPLNTNQNSYSIIFNIFHDKNALEPFLLNLPSHFSII